MVNFFETALYKNKKDDKYYFINADKGFIKEVYELGDDITKLEDVKKVNRELDNKPKKYVKYIKDAEDRNNVVNCKWLENELGDLSKGLLMMTKRAFDIDRKRKVYHVITEIIY